LKKINPLHIKKRGQKAYGDAVLTQKIEQKPENLPEKVIAGAKCKIIGENSIRVVQEDRSNIEKINLLPIKKPLEKNFYEDTILLQKVNQEPEVLLGKAVERLENLNEYVEISIQNVTGV
jgi:hypothetical protein